jgi:putative MATE family efflux protein
MVIGIVSVILFNLVDTYYVSRLGAEALTAISFTFPVVSFIGSVSIGLGIAVASMVSRNLGAGNRKVAEEQTTQGIAFAVVFVIFVSVVGLYTIGPLFRALGASGEDLVLIRSYMEIWYFGAAFVVVPMVGNSAIRASGDTRSPAFIMLFAGLSNAVLDPLLIFGLGPFPEMGIRGAAVATVTSRGLTLILSLWILHYREKLLRIAALTAMKRIIVNLREFLVIGIPAAITQSITPITVGILTRILSEFGDDSVAAFGAGSRVEMVLLILPFSLAAGMAPFVGQNYGAERRDRLGKALRISLMTGAAMGVVLWLVMLPLAGPIAAIFSEEVTIRNEIQWFLWIVPAGHAAQHVFFLVNSTFNAIGDAWKGTLLASARTFIYILGLALLLSHFYGALGVFIGIAAGNVFTAVTSLYVSRNLWLPSKTKAP